MENGWPVPRAVTLNRLLKYKKPIPFSWSAFFMPVRQIYAEFGRMPAWIYL